MSHHDHHATAQDHPYHLVNPSKMPVLSAASLMLMLTGALRFMHHLSWGTEILAIGTLCVIACMIFWWRDVIREGWVEKVHTHEVRHGLRAGMALFIVSEVMFFVAFFWAFFNASLFPTLPVQETWQVIKGVWPPKGVTPLDAWHIPFMNTLILLLSGTTVTWAHYALLEGRVDEVKQGLWCTVLLGASFTSLQAYEYIHATFHFKEGIYPTTFFMATGFHGFHVLIGTTFLAVCLARVYKGQLVQGGHLGFEFAAWYWHFVDVVWLFLFAFVYWWGGAGYVHP